MKPLLALSLRGCPSESRGMLLRCSRRTFIRDAGASGLRTAPLKPSCSRPSVSRSSVAVNATMGISSCVYFLRMSWVASTPPMQGMLRSISARSKGPSSAARTASSPSPTTTRTGSLPSSLRPTWVTVRTMTSWLAGLSSANRMRTWRAWGSSGEVQRACCTVSWRIESRSRPVRSSVSYSCPDRVHFFSIRPSAASLTGVRMTSSTALSSLSESLPL
mmetsp:Transcript_20160/g.51609  ORF Transcript_20160/g.51609 Transcript_20160/m.51609 type:complete len:218 (-) Transcript_20160:72-725(-)